VAIRWEDVWPLADQIASMLYPKLHCKPISKDRRGRCNPIVVWNFFTQAARLALEQGVEDPKHTIDWEGEIDPNISRDENLAKLSQFFATLGRNRLPLDELDATAASYIDMEIDWIERVLEEEEEKLTPEEREELLKRLAELRAERERFFGKAKERARREYKRHVERRKKEKPEAIESLEKYFTPTLEKFIESLPEAPSPKEELLRELEKERAEFEEKLKKYSNEIARYGYMFSVEDVDYWRGTIDAAIANFRAGTWTYEKAKKEIRKVLEDLDRKYRGILEKARPPYPREPHEKPDDIKYYEKQLKLNILGWRRETPPGFRYPVWVMWVRDEGTGEVIKIVMGYPYTEREKYDLVRITNKLGHVVTVLAFREEKPKVEPKVAPHPEVSEDVEEAGKSVEEVLATKPEIKKAMEEALRMLAEKPFNWAEFRRDMKYFWNHIPVWERAVNERNDVALYGYLVTFRDKVRVWLDSLARQTPELHERYAEVEAAKPELPPPKLSKEEIDKLWRIWEETLRKHGIDPYMYRREYFDEDVALAKDFNEALFMIQEDMRYIIASKSLERKHFKTKVPKRLSWKEIGWGVSFIKVKLMSLSAEIEHRNIVNCYKILREILDATYKLLEQLQKSTAVRRFRDVTGIE